MKKIFIVIGILIINHSTEGQISTDTSSTSSVTVNNYFWKGEIINSSESLNSGILVNDTLYSFENSSWIKDIEIPEIITPNPVNLDIDKNNNVWVFADKKTGVYQRNNSRWSYLKDAPIIILTGKVIDNYVYCGNYSKIYRLNFTSADSDWELIFDCSAYDGDTYLDFHICGNTIYVAKYLFEVIKSTIGTNVWQKILRTPTSPAKIVVTNDIICVGTYWSGIFSSTDSGTTWVNGFGLPEGRGTGNFLIKNKNEIFVLVTDQMSTDGWYYSSNSGNSFTPITSDFNPWVSNQMRDLQIKEDRIIINAGYRGFFMSNDNGVNWLEINNGCNNSSPHHVMKIINTIDNELIALASNGGVPLPWYQGTWGIFKSVDNGLTWHQIDNTLQPTYKIIEDIIETTTGDLVVAPYDPGCLYILRYKTQEWIKIDVRENLLEGTIMGSTFELLEKGSDGTIYAGTFWDGILKSTDGGLSWIKIDFGIPDRGVRSIAIDEEKIYIVCSDQKGYVGLFFSDNGGSTWQQLNDDGIEFNLIKVSENVLIGISGSHIFKSEDNGSSWREISDNLTSSSEPIMNAVFVRTGQGAKSDDNSDLNLVINSNDGVFQKNINNYGWKMILNKMVNCICYSEKTNQIHFGDIEKFFSQGFNIFTDIYFPAVNQENCSVILSTDNKKLSIKNLLKSEPVSFVYVLDLKGQIIKSQPGEEELVISIGTWKPGLYIVVLKYSNGRIYSKKIIIRG